MPRSPYPSRRTRRATRALGASALATAVVVPACSPSAVLRKHFAPDTMRRARPEVVAAARPPAGDTAACSLARTTPEAAGIAGPALDSLVAAARRADSDALLVMRDGRIAYEEYRTRNGAEERHNIQSVSKAVSALVIGTLVDDGTIRSLDQPLGDFFPEWRDGERGRVTLRMLLEHTSGVAAGRGGRQLQEHRDALAWARTRPLSEPPGTRWRYNNVGIFLAASAAGQAAGRPLGAVAAERLFAPLCIDGAQWLGDRAGHTDGYTGLYLRARDLARLGQLVLDHGAWRGRQLVSAAYVDAVTRRQGGPRTAPFASSSGATGWFVRAAWDSLDVDPAAATAFADAARARGADTAAAAALSAYAGRRVARAEFVQQAARALGVDPTAPDATDSLGARTMALPVPRRTTGPAASIWHDGDGGQYLTVYPGSRIVVVRTRRWTKGDDRLTGLDGYYTYAGRLSNAARR